MFPIRFDFPFRKANGDLSTIGAEISLGGGGGGSYTLPTASAKTKGGIKVGTGLSMEGETLVNNNPTPATPYTLPTASAETKGGIKVGTGLSIDENGSLKVSLFCHNLKLVNNNQIIVLVNVVTSSSTPVTTLDDFLSLFNVSNNESKTYNMMFSEVSGSKNQFTIEGVAGMKALSINDVPYMNATVSDNVYYIS